MQLSFFYAIYQHGWSTLGVALFSPVISLKLAPLQIRKDVDLHWVNVFLRKKEKFTCMSMCTENNTSDLVT